MGGIRKPAFQFYPDDWRSDVKLQLCSLSARGLWIEMMVLMHYGEPYGHLRFQGENMEADELAKLVGGPVDEVKESLAELERRGVYSQDADGSIYSRRMVSDHSKLEAFRDSKVEAGKASGRARRTKAEQNVNRT